MPTFRIYLITVHETGKRYVGVTTMKLTYRLSAHRNHGPMAEDLQKSGAVTIEQIETQPSKELALAREAELIQELGTHAPQGYNGQVRGGRYPGRGGPKTGNRNSRRRAVQQFTRDGELVRAWETIMDAAKALGIQRNTIHRAIINPTYTAGGFKWRDAPDDASHGG